MANQDGGIKREVSVVLSEQRDVAEKIGKFVSNIGKTAHEHRNAANREVKEAELTSLWKQFEENNAILAVNLPDDHPYHAQQLSAATYTKVKLGREKLATWASLKEPGATPKGSRAERQAGSQATAEDKSSGDMEKPPASSKMPEESQLIDPLSVQFGKLQVGNEQTVSGRVQANAQRTEHPIAHHETATTPQVPTSAVPQSGHSATANGSISASRIPFNLPVHGQSSMANGSNASSSVPTSAYNMGLQPNNVFNPQVPTHGQAPGMAYASATPMFPLGQDPWAYSGTRQFAPAAPKLAPISIPAFTGEWKQWTTFIGLFESLIDKNPYLAPVQKLQYLINYLQGEALQCIAHIVLCNENYCVALDIVKRRYDNARKICDDYVVQILDLQKMESRSTTGILNIITVLTLSLHGLKRYNYDIDHWAPIIVACVTRKLDEESRQKFEESLEDTRKVPSIDTLIEFLDRRYQVLLRDNQKHSTSAKKKSFAAVTEAINSGKEKPASTCAMCQSTRHNIRQCESFLKLNISQRIQFIKAKKFCLNCFGDHFVNKCPSRFACKICHKRHHSLLHLEKQAADAPATTHSHLASKGDNVTLATALVKVRNIFGKHETLRALIDPGSQDSFITAAAAESLSLKKTRANVKVSGIGGANAGKIVAQVELHLEAHFPNKQQFHATALVLPRLTARLPEQPIPVASLPDLPPNFILADPTFHEPGPIDILLGAGLFAEIMKEGARKFNDNRLLLQNTELGWILTGRILHAPARQSFCLITISELDEKMRKFWDIDEEEVVPERCNELDEFFDKTTTRDKDGRYIVKLPRKKDVYGQLGASRNMAIARLINQEKAFVKNPHLACEYAKFLKEYEEMGHMTKVPAFAGPEGGAYYLPHHAVIKESSTTTKVRVVFNASAKTHTGLSLNSLLDPGHKQQQDLSQIIMRWRKHRVVVNADIEKMFRQIIVAPEDRDLQRIVWRSSPSEPIIDFQLNTVNYGTASATYLAVRTLIQLARDDGADYPIGKEALLKDFYMDDLLSGADCVKGALQIQRQITELLSKGGMNIRKWTSNSKELISKIPEEMRETGDWLLNPEATIKTLGVIWNPQRDEFRVRLNLDDFRENHLTKRSLLSNIATIFDPLGFLAPISFTCKTWMQQLWLEKTDWDERVSVEVENKWNNLFQELPLINKMIVPRWIRYVKGNSLQIHGFCDASEKGYAAVLYSRIVDSLGQVHISLLTAKSKVAPLKKQLTLPRMELLAARNTILRVIQQREFSDELSALRKNSPLPSKSRIQGLAPFIDSAGLLRVGGRLRQSDLAADAKNPILFPRNHPHTRNIVLDAHQRTLHGGAQLTLTLLRRTYWISDGRSTVQSVIRSCLRCRRFAVAAPTQQMGDLPAVRVTSAPAFERTGVDFCGPFLYRCSSGRGIKTTKGYVSVFVSFATKAIHGVGQ